MAARSSDLPGVTTARLTEDLVAGYERAFEGETVSEEIDQLPPPIRLVMKRAVKRTARRLLDERLGGKRKRFQLGRKFWRLDDNEREAVRQVVEQEPVRRLITRLEDRDAASPVRLVDAAFWVKGCSSLGLWRVAALVEFREAGKKKGPRLALLDFKQAVDPFAPWAAGLDPSLAPAMRVLSGAQRLAPALGSRMLAAKLLERSVFIRELLPQDLKVELDRVDAGEARQVAYYLGKVVGRSHRRQMDGEATRTWMAELAPARLKSLDAPSWLWSALVQLVGFHEHALPRALPPLRPRRGPPGRADRPKMSLRATRANQPGVRARAPPRRQVATLRREILGRRIALLTPRGYPTRRGPRKRDGWVVEQRAPGQARRGPDRHAPGAQLLHPLALLLRPEGRPRAADHPGGGAELKSYASGGQVPLARDRPGVRLVADRVSRIRLMTTMQIVFIGCLVGFYILARAKAPIGLAFYIWLGIFNVLVVSNFWSFANDLFTESDGKRLFAVIGIGASIGAIAGAYTPHSCTRRSARRPDDARGQPPSALSIFLYRIVDRRERARKDQASPRRPNRTRSSGRGRDGRTSAAGSPS